MNPEITPETPAHFSAVYEVNKTAFEKDNEARLVEALRNSEAFIPALSLVAILDEEVVGHILFSRIQIKQDGETHESLALAPVSVIPGLQKQGIGSQLIRFGLNRAKEMGHTSVIVLGHEHYYPKFGFTPAANWNIRTAFDVPSDAFMALELQDNALKGVEGIVIYPKEFEEV